MADASEPIPGGRPAVVHVTPDPWGRGGMAAVVRGLLSSELTERYELDSITMHRVGSTALRVRVAISGLCRLFIWCVRHPRGLVHLHASVRGSLYRKAIGILIARAFRHPVLLQLHAGPGDIDAFVANLTPATRSVLRFALRRTQAIVSVSEAGSSALAAAFDLPEVGVLPNAAPVAPASPKSATADAALFLGGFFDPAKGGVDLVRALPALLEASPRLRVQLAGPGEPPQELVALEGDRVRWSAWLDDEAKATALDEAGIVLIPSRSEGLPVALLEAMAYGRAVVATAVGGIPDVLRDDVDGVIVAPGEGDAFVAAVAALVDDPARVVRLGGSARERVAELSEPKVIARIDAIYRKLLESSYTP